MRRASHSLNSLHPFGRSALRHRKRSGYTLLEVLLAVTVLMILASVASSPVLNVWRNNRLGEAAEDVRSLLAGSRIQSLDRDETWQFRYEPGGSLFVRVPTTTTADGQPDDTARSGRISGTLPAGITFSKDSALQTTSAIATGAVVSPDLFSGLSNAAELAQAGWSEPTYFYSDGTADRTEFELEDEYGGVRRISVRDLTGAVTVSRQNTL